MRAEHLEFLVEEPSMEAFLAELLPRLLANRATFAIHAHQGKNDLLTKLGGRLRAYARWLPETSRIVVIVDKDNQDCIQLKNEMEMQATASGLQTRTSARRRPWQVVNRIAIEELEAWYFGSWADVKIAYPRVSSSIPHKAPYREPDAILGGTWEALEKILKTAGYFSGGLRKTEIARTLGKSIDPMANTSPSFIAFRHAVLDAIA